jgi:hypothetical protein
VDARAEAPFRCPLLPCLPCFRRIVHISLDIFAHARRQHVDRTTCFQGWRLYWRAARPFFDHNAWRCFLIAKGPSHWNDEDATVVSRLIFVTSSLTFMILLALIVLLHKRILKASSRISGWLDGAFIIALSFVWFISLPYLQHKLNTVAKVRQ